MTTEEQRMAAAKLLRDAVALIQKHGWVKGQVGNKRRGFCALGAIDYAAISHSGGCHEAVSVLENVVGGNVAEFNDSPRRTKPDGVLRAMRKAARMLEGSER